jgi:hypothetical protein
LPFLRDLFSAATSRINLDCGVGLDEAVTISLNDTENISLRHTKNFQHTELDLSDRQHGLKDIIVEDRRTYTAISISLTRKKLDEYYTTRKDTPLYAAFTKHQPCELSRHVYLML